VTGFASGSNGRLYAVTGNIGESLRLARSLSPLARSKAMSWTPAHFRIGDGLTRSMPALAR